MGSLAQDACDREFKAGRYAPEPKPVETPRLTPWRFHERSDMYYCWRKAEGRITLQQSTRSSFVEEAASGFPDELWGLLSNDLDSLKGVNKTHLPDPKPPRAVTLTFDELREANRNRDKAFWGNLATWDRSVWSTALGEEMGEAFVAFLKLVEASKALGKIKRMKRKHNKEGNTVTSLDIERLKEELGDELADIVIYADLLAQSCGFSLASAVIRKFNNDSATSNCPITL